MLGWLDLWAYREPGLKTVYDLAGVDFRALEEVLQLRRIDVSIAISKNTSDAIGLLAEHLDEMRKLLGWLFNEVSKWRGGAEISLN